MFDITVILIGLHFLITIQYSMADNICNQLVTGDYKTVRLLDGKIRLIYGDKYYTFKEGGIKSAQIKNISELYPYNSTPIDQTFVNNQQIYYIRGNQAVVYSNSGDTPNAYVWRLTDPSAQLPRLIIKRKGEITGLFVAPQSSNSGIGQSMSSSNDIQVLAYGSSSSVSISNINGFSKITYNGWRIPVQFNAFLSNSDNSLTFFNGDMYCVVTKNSNSDFNWKEVKTLFGC